MADVELVIKIPEELISDINDKNYQSIISWYNTTLYRAIKDGTPLPKGHSDLIDRNALLDTVPDLNAFEQDAFDTEWMVKLVDAASPIIKADKE